MKWLTTKDHKPLLFFLFLENLVNKLLCTYTFTMYYTYIFLHIQLPFQVCQMPKITFQCQNGQRKKLLLIDRDRVYKRLQKKFRRKYQKNRLSKGRARGVIYPPPKMVPVSTYDYFLS